MTNQRHDLPRYAAGVMLTALITLLAACSSPQTPPNVQTIVSGATADEISGTLQTGVPDSDPEAPDASVTGAETIIPGGSALFSISGSAPFTTIYVSVTGTPDYYEIQVEETESQDIVLNFSPDLNEPSYILSFAVGNGNGAGTAASHGVAVEGVGTGELQISLSWDVPSDLDLLVQDPAGDWVYWGNRDVESGGTLDLDSNSACGGSDKRTENVTWAGSTPPTGSFQVVVNQYSACGNAETKYVVTVRMGDASFRTFEGTFTAEELTGLSFTDRLITSFDYPPAE